MPGAPFSVNTKRGGRSTLVEGLEEVIDRLSEVQDAAGDLRPVWDELGPVFAERMQDVFATNGYGSWQINAASTIAGHQSPLVDEGVMREGLTLRRPIWKVAKSASYGADKTDQRVMNVAVLNTVGHRSPRGNPHTPARRVVPPLRPSEVKQWLGIIEGYLMRAAAVG